MFASAVLIFGMALVIVMQLLIVAHAFKNSLRNALLCLSIPFYVYIYAKKNPVTKKLLAVWYVGLLCMAGGTMLLS